MANASDVAHLVRLNGGHLVGKTRLQKSAYFLEALGAGFGFDFGYYHFGPYSEDLSSSTDEATALKLLDVDWKQSQGGSIYAVFHCNDLASEDTPPDSRRRSILEILKQYSAVELELAATTDFLKLNGYASDPWAETRRRKATKVDDFRVSRSKQLLKEIDAIRYST